MRFKGLFGSKRIVGANQGHKLQFDSKEQGTSAAVSFYPYFSFLMTC
jgi:hypothetical protein